MTLFEPPASRGSAWSAGFHEGTELYPNTTFKTKNHIQIAVRDKNCIKGYFAPRKRVASSS